jgi:hypothetical protein
MILYLELPNNQNVLLEQLKTTNFKTIIVKKNNISIQTSNYEVIEFNNDINEVKEITSNDYLLSFSKFISNTAKNIGIVNDTDYFLNKDYISKLNIIVSIAPLYTKLFESTYPDKKIFNGQTDLIEILESIMIKEFLHVIIQIYKIEDSARLEEITHAINLNLNHSDVVKVHCLLESDNIVIPLEIKNHKKYTEILLNKWFTYKDVFDYVNKNLQDKYCCLLNLDISLDYESDWSNIKKELDSKKVYALSRHEYNVSSKSYELDINFKKLFNCHSQDAWLFKGPMDVKDCDFEIGVLGCDNAIAHRLHNSGYMVINKPLEYKIFHHDIVRGKNTQNFKDFHKDTSQNKLKKSPEKLGYRLLPNYDDIINISLDNLIKQLHFSKDEKYDIICKIFTKKIAINNS